MSGRVQRINPSLIVLIVLLGVLGLGLMSLLNMRYSAGDMYPRYSTMREDQVGAKALYESLNDVHGIDCERQLLHPREVVDMSGESLLYLGMTRPFFKDDLEILLNSVKDGGRLVITFAPYKPGMGDLVFQNASVTNTSVLIGTNGVQVTTNAVGSVSNAVVVSSNVLNEVVGEGVTDLMFWDNYRDLDVKLAPLSGFRGKSEALLSEHAPEWLPATLTGYPEYGFRSVGKTWTSIYEIGALPVVLERRLGKGSVVISTVCYPFSNHALQHERSTAFLRWVVGDGERVRFDETHFGVSSVQGVGTLARKYHLEWLGLGIVILGILFVWRSSTRVVPAYTYDSWGLSEARRTGKDSLSGLENLLSQHVSRHMMIRTLLTVFKKSAGASVRLSKEMVTDINELVRWAEESPSEERDVSLSKYFEET